MTPRSAARKHQSAEVISNAQLKKYCDVISAWRRHFDTEEIARLLDLPEALVARWVANFQDMKQLSTCQRLEGER